MARLIKGIRKALDTASDVVGTKAVVKVGANLAKNVKHVVQGKPQERLYAPTAKKSELFKDVSGIATAGTLAVGGIAGLGAKKAAAKAVEAPKAIDGISAARKALMTEEAKAGHAFKALQRASRGLKY